MNAHRPYGWEVILDLQHCNPTTLASKARLIEFVEHLCANVIAMRRFGEPLIEWFGSAEDGTDGYTVVQLIEWSSVVGHFSSSRQTAHLNIFSCRPFDSRSVELFARDFFDGSISMVTRLERG